MTEAEFWDSNQRAFYNRHKGWLKLREEAYKDRYEMMRLQTYYILSPHLKKGNNDIKTFMRLPWEEAEMLAKVEVSEKKRIDMLKRMASIGQTLSPKLLKEINSQ